MACADESEARLGASDAVAALILTLDGRYVLQHRDEVPGIWYPGHWGCFGGAVAEGEEPLQALWRELFEEIELTPRQATFFTRFDFDLAGLGLGRYYRSYYVVRLDAAEENHLVLHEGQALGCFTGATIERDLRVAPYDAFALHLHYARGKIGGGTGGEAPATKHE